LGTPFNGAARQQLKALHLTLSYCTLLDPHTSDDSHRTILKATIEFFSHTITFYSQAFQFIGKFPCQHFISDNIPKDQKSTSDT
jgi:hypothetical protein